MPGLLFYRRWYESFVVCTWEGCPRDGVHGGCACFCAVVAKPLHQILTPEEVARCRLIKIDIGGAEPPVVYSIRENIALFANACEIAVEVSVHNADLLEVFERAGFHAYYLENGYPNANYVRQRLMAPRRFRGKIQTQSDFIFSRREQDFL